MMFKKLFSRWKQYRYRLVPWIAFNLKNRSVRSVSKESLDKVIPDQDVDRFLRNLFSVLDSGHIEPPASRHRVCYQINGLPQHDNETRDNVKHKRQTSIRYQTDYVSLLDITKQLFSAAAHQTISGCIAQKQCSRFTHINKSNYENFQNIDGMFNLNLVNPNWDLLTCNNNTTRLKHTCKCIYGKYGTPGNVFNYGPILTPPAETGKRCLSQGHTAMDSNEDLYRRNLQIMKNHSGFCVERATSTLPGGGTGVKVTQGTIPKGTVVGMYPGAVYHLHEPILLQSIGNPFVFRCIDGLLIDGNDKRLSKFLFRSCGHRDRIGHYFTCDMTWLTKYPVNPLAVGQYVNNHNKENPPNVAYQEFEVPESFPFHLRRYIPNVFYSPSIHNQGFPRLMKTVVLVSLREIKKGEELFSSYFTVVH